METNDKLIRRLRKKLQQIENLELLGRPLNDEELCKVGKKDLFRAELAKRMSFQQQQTEVKAPTGTSVQKSLPTGTVTEIYELVKPVHHTGDLEMKRAAENPADVTPNENKNLRPEVGTELSKDVSKNDTTRRFPLSTSSFWLHSFPGHNDIVTSVAIDRTCLVSASRDTSIKVWNFKSRAEPTTLRGHSNFISSVVLISQKSLSHFSSRGNLESEGRLLLSASLDCCVKLWDVGSGEPLRSIYTFNGVTSLEHVPRTAFCVIGTEGGKLEIYNLNSESTSPVWSVNAFSDAVSCLKVLKDRMYASSLDGTITVWELIQDLEKMSAKLLYRTEDPSFDRPIRCFTVSASGDVIYYGVEGCNLRALHWRMGKVEKLPNHPDGAGITNAVSSSERLLVSSSFDVGTGIASINVRCPSDESYVCTLNPGEPNRILSIAVFEDSSRNALYVATGGTELCVWEAKYPLGKLQSKSSRTVKPSRLEKLSLPAEDTEVDEESESDDEEDGLVEEDSQSAPVSVRSSWCTLM